MAHIDTKNLGFDTKVIHAGGHHDPYGSATVPIYQTSTFAFDNAKQGADRFAGTTDGFIYTRLGNPTINALERQMAELEGGFAGIATSSGMGAVSTVYMALLDQGTHMVGTASVYGPSRLLAEKHLSRFGVESSWIDTTDLGNLRRAMRPTTRIVYTESVANPTMDVTDIRGAADIAHEHGALLVVDNTFCSPFLHRPFEFGADVVLHSVTKFLNGHADVVGGIVVAKDEALYRKLRPHDDDPRVQHGPPPGLPGAARPEDAVAAHRTGAGKRRDHRPMARGAAAGGVGAVRRAALSPAARSREAADERLRRDDRVRPEGRSRGRPYGDGQRAARHAGRLARRRRNAHRAPGVDDTRRHVAASTARSRASATASSACR